MNLNKEKIEKKINSLKCEAEFLGIELNISTEIYENKQHHMWYAGEIANFDYKNFNVAIEAVGDIVVILHDKNGKDGVSIVDKWNNGDFYNIMKKYIPDDNTLIQYLNKGIIEIIDNNWIEVTIYDNDKNEWIELHADTILNEKSVLEAIKIPYFINLVDNYIKRKAE